MTLTRKASTVERLKGEGDRILIRVHHFFLSTTKRYKCKEQRSNIQLHMYIHVHIHVYSDGYAVIYQPNAAAHHTAQVTIFYTDSTRYGHIGHTQLM